MVTAADRKPEVLSPSQHADAWDRLQDGTFDVLVLVVGGGVTGAGVARTQLSWSPWPAPTTTCAPRSVRPQRTRGHSTSTTC